MDEQQKLIELAYKTLYNWTLKLCYEAGLSEEYGEKLWDEIKSDNAMLQEYAYYHDNNRFLCRYQIEGYTLADIMVWQMDHFRAHMDRLDNDLKSNSSKLILVSFEMMLELKKNPTLARTIAGESGTDMTDNWTIVKKSTRDI